MSQHFNPKDLPDSIPPEVRAHYERHAMEAEDSANEIIRFFRDSSVESLVTITKILQQCANTEHGLVSAVAFLAWVEAAIEFVHGRCRVCGKDHSAELLGGENAHPIESDKPTRYPDAPDTGKPEADIDRSTIDYGYAYPLGVEPHLTHEDTTNMRAYNIDALYVITSEGVQFANRFQCNNCGLEYASIADRMLKGRDDCHGCHLKSAHG